MLMCHSNISLLNAHHTAWKHLFDLFSCMGTLLPKDTKSQQHVVQGEKATQVNGANRFDQNKVPFFFGLYVSKHFFLLMQVKI